MSQPRLRYVFLGLSITSSWGNGHATTYRGLVRELAARGHDVLFLERDLPFYTRHRDLPRPPWGHTVLYRDLDELFGHARAIEQADFVIVGSYVPDGAAVGAWACDVAPGRVGFYDIDTPVTLDKLDRGEPCYVSRELIRRFAVYLSFTGGPTLTRLEGEYGARRARPLYCSVDPSRYSRRVVPMRWDLGYLGTYSDDRQPALDQLLLEPARAMPSSRFVIAGAQYPASIPRLPNVSRFEHVPPLEHPSFYSAQRFTLNVTRAPMVAAGFSPSVRIFEAAACGTPIISDRWAGIETVLEPGREVLIADTSDDVRRILRDWGEERRASIGRAARARILAEHTAAHRAEALLRYTEEALQDGTASTRAPSGLSRWETAQ